ncbi:MAG: hypothetical protein QOG88_885 [Actinomycetota bacterium]|nr:hypothetical protein [Actinomycetota bacterium]
MYSSRPEPETAYDLYVRGRALLQRGDAHAAAVVLGRAKLLEPDKASIREALGRAHYLSGRFARARREFAKAVQLDPSDDYGHFALALACERSGQSGRAVAHAKLAVALKPEESSYRDVLERLTA